jgi:hypothetical protein
MQEQKDTHTPHTLAKAPVQIACPFCRSTDTEFLSLFGQQLLTIQVYCNACHTPFECVKDDDLLDAYDTARKEHAL